MVTSLSIGALKGRILKSQNNIYIFGDAMVDRWITCTSTRQSAEADIPIYSAINAKNFPGGCANVARALNNLGMPPKLCYNNDYTELPRKTRLVVDGQQIMRYDEHDYCRAYNGLMPPDGQIIVVSDYGKGAINAEQIAKILDTKPAAVWVNTKFPTPDFERLDMAGEGGAHPHVRWLCNRDEYIADQAFYERQACVYVTKGAEGIEYKEYGKTKAGASSKARKVVSVCGAGDVVLAALVMYNHIDKDLPMGELEFAMTAAALAVENPYTYCPTLDEVISFLYE